MYVCFFVFNEEDSGQESTEWNTILLLFMAQFSLHHNMNYGVKCYMSW